MGANNLTGSPSLAKQSTVAEPQDSETPSGRLGSLQVVATAFLVLFCVVGLVVWGLPYYYDFMVRQFGWSRAQVTSGNALSKLIVGPVFGFIAGWMVDRFGPRRLMMAGILMAGFALAGLGSISTLGGFYFFYLFNALGYVCGGPLPCQVLLSRWFDKARGKAMGIAYLGIGFGGAVVPWISNLLVHQFGWQMALRILGVIVVVVAFPMAFLLREAPRLKPLSSAPERGAKVPLIHHGARSGPALEPGGAGGTPDTAAVRGAFTSLPFYLLAVGSMCSIAAVSGTQQNLKLYLSLDQHYTQLEAARILSLVLTFSIVGRLLMGWLADRIPKKHVMLLIYMLVAAAIPLLFLAPLKGTMYVFAAVFGIGLGGDFMIIPLMTAEIFGVRMLGRLMGVILTVDGVAEAAAPWIVGRLRDMSSSYKIGFVALIAMALVGALAVSALPKRQSDGEKRAMRA